MGELRVACVCLVAGALLGCKSPVELKSIELSPSGASVEQGVQLQPVATGHYSDGTTRDLSATATWSSSATTVATINGSQRVFTVGVGATTLTATSGGKMGSAALTVTPRQSFPMPYVGLWTQFDDRANPGGYFGGQNLHEWNMTESALGHTVAAETAAQLDVMQSLGVTNITFALRSTDPGSSPGDPFVPPACPENPALGLDYPTPDPNDLVALGQLLDLLQARGMTMWLDLVNVNMEKPNDMNAAWLTPILQAVGNHPALDVIIFDGTQRTITFVDGTVHCNLPGEAPLWTGPGKTEANYVQLAIGLALSLGIPARKLTAESISGSWDLTTNETNTSGYFAGNHFWFPVDTMRIIFDNLGIAPADRTYALSFYEERKCTNVFSDLTCTDEDPHPWADEALGLVVQTVGTQSRIVASEMGDNEPVMPGWSTEQALESIYRLFPKHGLAGGSFWRWANFTDAEETDPTRQVPIKQRGMDYVFNPTEKLLVDAAGWHLPGGVANGSFESGSDHWTGGGSGSATAYDLTQEPGQPVVPWRGTHVLRLVTGDGANDVVTATSEPIAAQPAIVYTTTAVLRFSFADDSPTATITISYLRTDGQPSAVRASDSFAFHRSDRPSGFGTFPVQYAPPRDAASVQVQIAVARNGSAMPATVDVDDVR